MRPLCSWKPLFFFARVLGVLGHVMTPGGLAWASWEASARIGFDSNVNLSLEDPRGDGYVSGAFSFLREPSWDTRWDWTLAAIAEAGTYAKSEDLAFASLRVVPGLTYAAHHTFSVGVFPFFQAQTVRDPDQRALTFGAKGSLEQYFGRRWYTGQYYIYTLSRADAETYSFSEHLFGLFLGLDWTQRLSSEMGYEYSRGDSFRAVVSDSSAQTVAGRGRHRRYSEALGSDVIREKVDRHAVGVHLGLGLTAQMSSQLSYVYTIFNGTSGIAHSHRASLAFKVRF